jgi:uncharacterized membrane protein
VSGLSWLLALHLLSAVALGGAMTAYWALVLATRPERDELPPAAASDVDRTLNAVVAAGAIGTLVFGVWIAIVSDRYGFFDGWILAAIVLWAIAMELGRRTARAFAAGSRAGAIRWHAGSTLVVLALLVVMIWKPGA